MTAFAKQRSNFKPMKIYERAQNHLSLKEKRQCLARTHAMGQPWHLMSTPLLNTECTQLLRAVSGSTFRPRTSDCLSDTPSQRAPQAAISTREWGGGNPPYSRAAMNLLKCKHPIIESTDACGSLRINPRQLRFFHHRRQMPPTLKYDISRRD